MKRKIVWALAVLAIVFASIQFIQVDRGAAGVESEVNAPPQVRAVFQRACYDCHSNETVWPAYSRVAPVSWIIASHIQEGRDHLNLSTWNRLSATEQVKMRQEIWREVERGEMPPWYYVPFHPAAHLTDEDRALLRDWATAPVPTR